MTTVFLVVNEETDITCAVCVDANTAHMRAAMEEYKNPNSSFGVIPMTVEDTVEDSWKLVQRYTCSANVMLPMGGIRKPEISEPRMSGFIMRMCEKVRFTMYPGWIKVVAHDRTAKRSREAVDAAIEAIDTLSKGSKDLTTFNLYITLGEIRAKEMYGE